MKTIRWIALLPASALALILSTFIFRLLPSIWGEDINVDGLIYQCALAYANVGVFMYVGYYIAPSYKEQALLILSVLMVLFSIGQIFLFFDEIKIYLENIVWSNFYENLGIILICRVVVSIGTAWTMYYVIKSGE